MNTLQERFHTWATTGDFTTRGLGSFRIAFGVIALLTLPNFHWVAEFPDSMYRAPFGPMRLFDSFPPAWVLQGLELIVATSCIALIIGWRTNIASVAFTVTSIIGYGFTYSMGKIDHTILLATLPIFLAGAGWAKAMSVDAARNTYDSGVRHWPLRLFSLLIGLAFATAAVPKIVSGWLDPSTQAVQQSFFNQYFRDGDSDYLANFFIGLDVPIFWEAIDYFTVAFEALFVLSIVSWTWFRRACAVAAVFHFGVFAMMNIAFFRNVVVYAAFARWDTQRWSGDPLAMLRFPAAVTTAVGVICFSIVTIVGNANAVVPPLVLLVGAVVGSAYLIRSLTGATRRSQVVDLRDESVTSPR